MNKLDRWFDKNYSLIIILIVIFASIIVLIMINKIESLNDRIQHEEIFYSDITVCRSELGDCESNHIIKLEECKYGRDICEKALDLITTKTLI